MVTTPPRGLDRAGAKPHGVASPHTPRVIRAREGLVDAPPARGGAARARGDARIALARRQERAAVIEEMTIASNKKEFTTLAQFERRL